MSNTTRQISAAELLEISKEIAREDPNEEAESGPYREVQVGGEFYYFNWHSVCYMPPEDDDEEGLQFWIYHGLGDEPTPEQVAATIRAAMGEE